MFRWISWLSCSKTVYALKSITVKYAEMCILERMAKVCGGFRNCIRLNSWNDEKFFSTHCIVDVWINKMKRSLQWITLKNLQRHDLQSYILIAWIIDYWNNTKLMYESHPSFRQFFWVFFAEKKFTLLVMIWKTFRNYGRGHRR